jgi:cardiolipin synthase
MQYHAARPVYRQLLEAGVEIYEYSESFLHAKVAVIDAHHDRPWATVGSSNLDPFSLLLAREANVVVADTYFAKHLRDGLEHAMASKSQRIMPQSLLQRSQFQRSMDWTAFGLMRLAIWLTGNRY